MKKGLLFALGAMMSMSALAQTEQDVTHYIQNAGFDEDLTWMADGSKKEIADQSKELSNRSLAGVAADGSLYALVNSKTDKRRSDGRTYEATNGFVGMMKGWDWVNLEDDSKPNPRIESKACEWVYFGALPYDLGTTAVPVADDGSTYLTVPAKPTAFDGGEAALYLRAGWGNSFAYKQVVKLPCAKYRLEYWTINVNSKTTATATDLSKIVCRGEVFQEDGGAALTAKEWTKHEFEFTPTAEFTIQFGFQAGDGGSGSTPWLFIDGIKLFKIGDADPKELLTSLQNDCKDMQGSLNGTGYVGLSDQIGDYEMALDDYMSVSVEEAALAITEADKQIAKFHEAIAAIGSIDAAIAKLKSTLDVTDYPGKAALQAAYERIKGYKENDLEEGVDVVSQLLGAVAEANQALLDYCLSQAATASEQNPADFTLLIKNPWFINSEAEPVFQDGEWTFPNQFDADGNDLYKEGSASSPDLNSTGWAITGASGGDQRLNWQRGRSCWNAWNSGFTTTIAVGQEITGLPNGYYTVAADMITQQGYVNETQCVYGESSAEKKVSTQKLTSDDYDNNVWETVSMTADDKVLVVNNKLTIGAQGTGDGNASAGWFLVTNFRLYYLGEAPADAAKNALDAKVATARELAAGMHFAADKKALEDAVTAFAAVEDIIVALDSINVAMAEAEKSEAKYVDYLPGEDFEGDLDSKTLYNVFNTLSDNGGEGYGAAEDIVKFAYNDVMAWIASDVATYVEMDATVELLKNYLNTYTPAYNAAAEVAEEATGAGKTALDDVMAAQKAELTKAMCDLQTVKAFVEELNSTVELVKKQMAYEGDGTDYTVFIKNPKMESENGWTFERGNGDKNTTSGQWFDGSSTRYIDSYHASEKVAVAEGDSIIIGLQNFKASQLVTDLPNGTYQVGVYTRTPAEGAYIFQAAVADTVFVEIPLDYYTYESEYSGLDTTVVASDKFGPIWEKATNEGVAPEESYEPADIANANNGEGRGWKHQVMAEIVVNNHELLIGTMCGTKASKTAKEFAGNWYSVGGWTLTLIAKGDNTGWSGPIAAGIETVKAGNAVADGIYTVSGLRMNRMQRGLNIVVSNGKAQKVLVK